MSLKERFSFFEKKGPVIQDGLLPHNYPDKDILEACTNTKYFLFAAKDEKTPPMATCTSCKANFEVDLDQKGKAFVFSVTE